MLEIKGEFRDFDETLLQLINLNVSFIALTQLNQLKHLASPQNNNNDSNNK